MLLQELTNGECLQALVTTRLGTLACAHENQPYVVPIYFVFEEPYLYGFTTPGQKVEWMRSNPLVCVEVDDILDKDEWKSILVFGRYEELPVTPEAERGRLPDHQPLPFGTYTTRPAGLEAARLRAHELLQEHAEWWEPGCSSSKHRSQEQPLTPLFYRIRIDRVTGRRATPSPSLYRLGSRSPARRSRSWLRRVFRAVFRPFAGPDSRDVVPHARVR
jgi:nitroimidazol reductase NimA-like FMN-containing flavoprotein (pyridoxamine 5'-phosphate oxidase superfamily)